MLESSPYVKDKFPVLPHLPPKKKTVLWEDEEEREREREAAKWNGGGHQMTVEIARREIRFAALRSAERQCSLFCRGAAWLKLDAVLVSKLSWVSRPE